MTALICPVCQTKGRRIQRITVESLAPEPVLARMQTREGVSYCPTPSCSVAWFHSETGVTVGKTELKVPVGMKETTGPRPICYCFDHDAAELEAEVRSKGHSDISAQIAAKCKQGLDSCEETNPQGGCCLGNVNKIVQAAKKDKELLQPFDLASGADCCLPPDTS